MVAHRRSGDVDGCGGGDSGLPATGSSSNTVVTSATGCCSIVVLIAAQRFGARRRGLQLQLRMLASICNCVARRGPAVGRPGWASLAQARGFTTALQLCPACTLTTRGVPPLSTRHRPSPQLVLLLCVMAQGGYNVLNRCPFPRNIT